MRARLLGQRARTPVVGIAASPDRHWRRVPKINILPRRQRTPPVVIMVRGLLAFIVVLEVFWVQHQYRAKAAVDETINEAKATLEREQRQLTAEQGSVQALQSQLNQLQQQRDAKERVLKEVTGGRIDWHTAIATLLAVEAPEATFESVIAQEEGKIALRGVAHEEKARATLPSKLRGMSDALDFQSIKWEAGNPTPKGGPIFRFTATFTVRR